MFPEMCHKSCSFLCAAFVPRRLGKVGQKITGNSQEERLITDIYTIKQPR